MISKVPAQWIVVIIIIPLVEYIDQALYILQPLLTNFQLQQIIQKTGTLRLRMAVTCHSARKWLRRDSLPNQPDSQIIALPTRLCCPLREYHSRKLSNYRCICVCVHTQMYRFMSDVWMLRQVLNQLQDLEKNWVANYKWIVFCF